MTMFMFWYRWAGGAFHQVVECADEDGAVRPAVGRGTG
jgi:hypothetical protein